MNAVLVIQIAAHIFSEPVNAVNHSDRFDLWSQKRQVGTKSLILKNIDISNSNDNSLYFNYNIYGIAIILFLSVFIV